jgi:microcin C transport system permease protein
LPRRGARGSRFDAVTTLAVLVGYAIPGFVLGILLIVLLAGGTFWEVFPLRGLTSDNWAELGWFARIKTTSGIWLCR